MAFSKIASGGVDGGVGDSLRPNANPIIINGDFGIWQRGTTVNNTNGAPYIADRWRNQAVWGSTAPTAAWTISRSTDVPTGQGFVYSTKYDNTTAQSSLTSDTGYSIEQRFEGYQLQWMKKGTASAEATTLAFWVKSNKTGTYVVELYDVDNSRHCSQSYTISSSGTWEKKVLNFPADTTGAFGNDNGHSMKIRMWLAAGSAYTGGTLATSWASNTANNAAVGQVNLADNTSNEFFLTGVQWEIGTFTSSTLPPFQHESYGDNLTRCLRYYYRANGRCGFGAGSGFVQDGAVKGYIYHTMPVAPRTEMSFSLSATGGAISIDGNAGDDVQSIGATHSDSFPYKDYEFNFVTDGTSITDKCGMGIRINASHYIEGSAEL